jgi:hypothetical protein
MQGRDFLELARELLAGTFPRHRRGVIIHAYYALLLECRETMARWGIPAPPRQQAHAQIRLRLIFAGDPTVKGIGYKLERLGQYRNLASYDLRALPMFASAKEAQEAVQNASDGIALLDTIDVDPVRRAAAIASIKP